MFKRLAYHIVLRDMVKNGPGFFRGIFDAKNGSENYMMGVGIVEEYMAYRISRRTGDKWNRMFERNLLGSIIKAEK